MILREEISADDRSAGKSPESDEPYHYTSNQKQQNSTHALKPHSHDVIRSVTGGGRFHRGVSLKSKYRWLLWR